MLTLNLAPIFKARRIDNPVALLKKAGLSPHIASNFVNKKTIVISLKQIETLCLTLYCEPNDLFSFTADPKTILAADHPMQHFSKQENVDQNQKDVFSTMPLKQLKEVTKALTDKSIL
jgi:DNA-binding Xre family transcriptional regulator